MDFCTNCGERVSADDKFCSACGAPLDGTKLVTGASGMSAEEKAEFQRIIEQQRHNDGKTMAVRHQRPAGSSAADDTVLSRSELTGQDEKRPEPAQRPAGQNPFEKRVESGYYQAPVPPVQPPKKKGISKIVLIVAILAGMLLITATGMAFVFGDDTYDPREEMENSETSEEREYEELIVEEPADHSVLDNLDIARKHFEPDLTEIGFVIDDYNTSIDNNTAFYRMSDNDDSVFGIYFSDNGKRFSLLQMESCSWSMAIRMLELCEKNMDISFDRKNLDEMKAMAEQDSAKAEDHVGFSEAIYVDEYMCTLMVSPLDEDDSINEYHFFIEEGISRRKVNEFIN